MSKGPTRTLKACIEEFLPVITTIINTSLREGVFPNALKEGLLRSKFKNALSDKEDLVNFRPITNLAFVSKLLE